MKSSSQNILITGARAPVALHLARLLHFAGHRVMLADTPAYPIAAASTACTSYRRLPPPRFAPDAYAEALQKVLLEERIDLVIPTCEEVFYLAQIWRKQTMAAPLFAPAMDLLTRVHNKYEFIRFAEGLGLAVPETILLKSRDDVEMLRNRCKELVFKPVWSRFATQVLLRPQPKEIDKIAPTVEAPWVAQSYLDGEEISVYAVAINGKLKAYSAYHSIYRAGKGAGVCFRPVEEPGARAFVEAVTSASGWNGQISFDFMKTKDSVVFPLECNPRATSGLHFFTDPKRFSEAFLTEGDEVPFDVKGVLGVKLAVLLYGLPQAIKRGEFRKFCNCLRETTEILDWPGDSGPHRAQIRALAEIAKTAARQFVSLQKASTRDIEWNGPDQSSI